MIERDLKCLGEGVAKDCYFSREEFLRFYGITPSSSLSLEEMKRMYDEILDAEQQQVVHGYDRD